MSVIRPKRYKKDAEHSYTLGVFPTLELLTHQPQHALQVFLHPRGMKNAGIAKIQTICEANGIPLEVQEKAFTRLGARENDYAAAIFTKSASALNPTADHLVLIHPERRGNLGTIMRTMLGFGLSDLAIIQPAADPFHPETVRASMGALFQLRLARFDNFAAYHQTHPRPLILLMTDGETPLPEVNWPTPAGLVFGPESAGLPSEYRQSGHAVSIPQSGAIDSLNLAIAVGVTLYQRQLARRR